MNVLLINGSPKEHGCTYTALSEVAASLHRHSISTEMLYLGIKPIAGCIACMKCREKGHCVFDDAVNEVLAKLESYDAIVIGSPVYYAAPAGNLLSFLNRLFFCGGARMAGKLGASVVSCRRGGAASAFDQLNKYFTICNMPIVASQYWNQVHGSVPDDVRQDEEGLQTMRTLGENMAWLLACIQAGRQQGVPKPAYEPHLWTNFIR
ncbi:MAG: flavodoxin family protein [Desulfovibrionaceae bacterium]|nr:flavodoxin family protein [Desulfovibrionaceae bacterium]